MDDDISTVSNSVSEENKERREFISVRTRELKLEYPFSTLTERLEMAVEDWYFQKTEKVFISQYINSPL